MIRITQQNSAGDAKRYYATADYYNQGQEIVGRWGGKGAVRGAAEMVGEGDDVRRVMLLVFRGRAQRGPRNP